MRRRESGEAVAGNLSAAATPELFAAIERAHLWADRLRPRVHPENADDELVRALTALSLEVRALAVVQLLGTRP